MERPRGQRQLYNVVTKVYPTKDAPASEGGNRSKWTRENVNALSKKVFNKEAPPCPLWLNFEHDRTNNGRRGVINQIWFDDKTKWMMADFSIENPELVNEIKSGRLSAVSLGYYRNRRTKTNTIDEISATYDPDFEGAKMESITKGDLVHFEHSKKNNLQNNFEWQDILNPQDMEDNSDQTTHHQHNRLGFTTTAFHTPTYTPDMSMLNGGMNPAGGMNQNGSGQPVITPNNFFSTTPVEDAPDADPLRHFSLLPENAKIELVQQLTQRNQANDQELMKIKQEKEEYERQARTESQIQQNKHLGRQVNLNSPEYQRLSKEDQDRADRDMTLKLMQGMTPEEAVSLIVGISETANRQRQANEQLQKNAVANLSTQQPNMNNNFNSYLSHSSYPSSSSSAPAAPYFAYQQQQQQFQQPPQPQASYGVNKLIQHNNAAANSQYSTNQYLKNFFQQHGVQANSSNSNNNAPSNSSPSTSSQQDADASSEDIELHQHSKDIYFGNSEFNIAEALDDMGLLVRRKRSTIQFTNNATDDILMQHSKFMQHNSKESEKASKREVSRNYFAEHNLVSGIAQMEALWPGSVKKSMLGTNPVHFLDMCGMTTRYMPSTNGRSGIYGAGVAASKRAAPSDMLSRETLSRVSNGNENVLFLHRKGHHYCREVQHNGNVSTWESARQAALAEYGQRVPLLA